MAIKFDLFENPVKEGVSAPKLHAKVITKDVVTTRETVKRYAGNVPPLQPMWQPLSRP
jgi:hypothetical protein